MVVWKQLVLSWKREQLSTGQRVLLRSTIKRDHSFSLIIAMDGICYNFSIGKRDFPTSMSGSCSRRLLRRLHGRLGTAFGCAASNDSGFLCRL